MSIGLTATELSWMASSIDDTTGDISDEIVVLTENLESLNEEQIELYAQATLYKKFYDWWTLLSTCGETEKQYSSGDYVSSPVTDIDIWKTAIGDDCQIYPIISASWTYLYPKRIDVLNGTDSSGYGDDDPTPGIIGPYEYAQIVAEEGAAMPADRLTAMQAQELALETYTIPAIETFISEATGEQSKYDFLPTLITQANSSLALAETALANVKAAIASHPSVPGDRAAYRTQRKSEITSRASQITTTFMDIYDQRYYWLDLRVNQEYGIYNDYVSINDTIVDVEYKLARYEALKADFLNYINS